MFELKLVTIVIIIPAYSKIDLYVDNMSVVQCWKHF
jgi:hypothetical protein